METMKNLTRILYSIVLLIAGILHFTRKRNFIYIMPKVIPFRPFFVLFTGICELMAGIALFFNLFKRLTGMLLTIFMILIYPVNIYMTFKKKPLGPKQKAHPVALWLRLPLQIPFIVGAYRWSKEGKKAAREMVQHVH